MSCGARAGALLAGVLVAALAGSLAAAQPPLPPKPPASAKPQATEQPADPDPAYSAFQRGLYLTAFREATKRVDEHSDVKSMTLLGELYADGLGVPNDDAKAANWYRLAAARGDREAMFALAMFRIAGRAGEADRPEAARLLGEAAQRGHVIAAYDLALLYLEGQAVTQDFARAATLMRQAADAGNPQAQYALATFYQTGRGVKKDDKEATRLLAASARAGMTEAEIEYGIALFNGTGTAKDERGAFPYFLKAAKKNSPIGQNRLALMYATGRGVKADPVEAARWHMIAKAGGKTDQFLDDFVARMKPHDRSVAGDKAKPWIARMQAVGPTPFPDPLEAASPQATAPRMTKP